jgi:hypothetical protein
MDEDGFGAKISMMDWETRTRVTRAKSGVRVGNQIYTTTKTIEVIVKTAREGSFGFDFDGGIDLMLLGLRIPQQNSIEDVLTSLSCSRNLSDFGPIYVHSNCQKSFTINRNIYCCRDHERNEFLPAKTVWVIMLKLDRLKTSYLIAFQSFLSIVFKIQDELPSCRYKI